MTNQAQVAGNRTRSAAPAYSASEGLPPGWRTFSGVMIAIVATWNLIDGLVAIFNASYYSSVASGHGIHLPLTDSVAAWGWVALITSIILFFVAVGVFADTTWAKVVGVVVVGFNMIFHLGFLASFPLWSLLVISLDVLVIYGLVVPTPDTQTA